MMRQWSEAIIWGYVGFIIGTATLPDDLINIRAAMASCESRAKNCEVTITVKPVRHPGDLDINVSPP